MLWKNKGNKIKLKKWIFADFHFDIKQKLKREEKFKKGRNKFGCCKDWMP